MLSVAFLMLFWVTLCWVSQRLKIAASFSGFGGSTFHALPLTRWRDGGVVVDPVAAVDLPVVVAKVVGGAMTLAIDEAVLARLLGVGAVDALKY
jgi:hypothetical protein